MSSSDTETGLLKEIEKMKKKVKKLSRRRRRKNRHDSRERSRSRSRQRSRSQQRSQTMSPPLIMPTNIEEQQQEETKENTDPVVVVEGGEEAPIPEALLVALGADKPKEPQYGPKINDLIASRWENLIINDCDETKETLSKYKIPDNCPLLEAPELNLEVKAALTDSARNRDDLLKNKQQQLGVALTCIGQAISTLLAGQEVPDAIKLLSDGAKLLISLHHNDTITRRQLIAPLLEKGFNKMAESLSRNKFLFGDNLSEKIKSNKEIERSGLQLRKPKPPTLNRPENWTGPSRQNTQQKNTAPRGGQRRAPPQPTKKTQQPAKKPVKRTSYHNRNYQRARR